MTSVQMIIFAWKNKVQLSTDDSRQNIAFHNMVSEWETF